ncbi:MAG: hypothetical protein ABJC13_07030 [Acidobacteriota bacterium]
MPGSKQLFRRTYAAPFGRYVAGSEAEPPANEVLIGRAGQRAYFIEILLRAGKRGAFLVTGNRGVGKTSFVRYCLGEYDEEVFERFLRSDVGRAVFWDRLFVALLGVVGLCIALMVSELLEILVLAGNRQGGSGANTPSLLGWIMIAPVVVACLYPMLYAWELFSELFRYARPTWLKHHSSIISALLTLTLAALIWRFPPFGAPALSIGILFHVLGGTFLLMTIKRYGSINWLWFAPLILLLLTPCIALPIDRSGSPEPNFLALLGFGFSFAAVAAWITGAEHKKKKNQLDEDPKAHQTYFAIAIGSTFVAFLCIFYSVRNSSLTVLVSSIIFILGSFFSHKYHSDKLVGDGALKPSTGNPKAIVLLSFKAVLSIVVCLHLLHPVISLFSPVRTVDDLTSSIRPAGSLWYVSGRHEHILGGNVGPCWSRSDLGAMDAPKEEQLWILALWLTAFFLYHIEYQWIVRPFLAARSSLPIVTHRPPGEGEGNGGPDDRRRLRGLARMTIPWVLYRAWLPAITVSVNLGFETLDHRRVIQAMLVGLQARYRRLFLSWNSALANLARTIGLLLLLTLVGLVGGRCFKLPELPRPAYTAQLDIAERDNYRHLCELLEGAQTGPGVTNLVCTLPWGDAAVRVLYFNITEGLIWKDYPALRNHLLLKVLPLQIHPWPEADRPFLTEGMSFRVYHLLIFVVLFIGSRWILRRLPFLPYRDVQRKIDAILDSLTASTSVTSRVGRWQPAQWLEGFMIGERVRQINQEPFDPRSVEFLFLHILEEIQEAAIRLPGARNQRFSLPVPEITFVFDELDKLGTRVGLTDEISVEPQQSEILNAERRRSLELHKLLADLKNLLASAPAKFIFVGGRNLHDEWLADQTSRLPLLTNIFSAEVYLPTLLTDRSEREEPTTLDHNIFRFVEASMDRAQRIYKLSSHRRRQPAFSLQLDQCEPDTFNDDRSPETRFERGVKGLNILTLEGTPAPGTDDLASDFIEFLAYRSMGNPKRLRELLGTFVRPLWRVVPHKKEAFRCDHVLVFEDDERFRIQLISRVYRHLHRTFARGFTRRDDKMTVSVFYLSDFLFKFHRRAFSWANLERVEDMVHIHRAPDLREVLETMVEQWSERFLHPIRNGMYDFRFRSEVAREVDYISRHSPAEMAAFNFTLDESQALKSVYETSIKRLREGNGKEIQDLVSGLGELYEFDQEYETARLYYRQATSLLDLELRAVTGGSEFLERQSPMLQIVGGAPPGPANARRYLTWGIARLRLILQVGMTFELSRNYERAGVEYGNASSLARSLLLALLDEEGRFEAVHFGIAHDQQKTPENRLHVLKHLNLVFQPVFAEAWVSEKLAGAVDTSVTLVESELWQLRRILPFVRDARVEEAESAVVVRHSNFALIAAELHGKAGDLLFFKGRSLVSKANIIHWAEKYDPQSPRHGAEGYLLRAHYHYAVALHELRRFTAYRLTSSKRKLNILEESPERPLWDTFEPGSWPDYVLRSLGGTLNDFAEVMLGRVSLFGLLQCLKERTPLRRALDTVEGDTRPKHDASADLILSSEVPPKTDASGNPVKDPRAIDELFAAFSRWMEQLSDKRGAEDKVGGYQIRIPLGEWILEAGTLSGWLGRWNEEWSGSDDRVRLVKFEAEGGRPRHDDLDRICVSLSIMLIGARCLELAGYVEDSAREFLKIADTAATYLWWFRSVQELAEWNSKRPSGVRNVVLSIDQELLTAEVCGHGFWLYLGNVALYALERADRLFRRGRKAAERREYLVGDRIPVDALVVACSLGLVSARPTKSNARTAARLRRLIRSWVGRVEGKKLDGSPNSHRELLENCLQRHSYPMLARLKGLKILIDHEILNPSDKTVPRAFDVPAVTERLVELSESFNSSLHFTPAQVGTTAALAYLLSDGDEKKREYLRRVAQRELMRSEEMYTLRRGFYENISDLYYLFDDLNDRQMHFGHALQMASSELVSLLLSLVQEPDRKRIGSTPLVLREV